MITLWEKLDSSVVEIWRRNAFPDLGPFVLPEWAEVWRTHFGAGSELVILSATDKGESTPWGVWALELHGDGSLEQLGGREATDYSAPAVPRERLESFAAEAAEFLAGEGLPWRRLHFEAIPDDIGFHGPFTDELSRRGIEVSVGFDEVCPRLELPSDFADYLRHLPSKHRHELRRKLRRFESTAGRPTIEVATETSLEDDLDQFFSWHRNSRGPKAAFMDLGYEQFFRDVARKGLADGWLRLSFLVAGGRRYSACYGFELGETYFLYNSAHDPSARDLSPGIVHVALLIELGIERGLRYFDFLQGSERYKMELGGRPRRLVSVDAKRTLAAL